MKTSYRSAGDPQPISVAMTPMIDVVFLLLIFFVCTASFQQSEQSLPSELVFAGAGIEAPVEQTPELDEVVIRVLDDGAAAGFAVNDAPCESLERLGAVLAALAEIDPGLPVIVDPDGPAAIGRVIAAYDASRRAGFQVVRFAASAE